MGPKISRPHISKTDRNSWAVTNYVPTMSVKRPCNVYWHVTAPYKLSFIIIIIIIIRGSVPKDHKYEVYYGESNAEI